MRLPALALVGVLSLCGASPVPTALEDAAVTPAPEVPNGDADATQRQAEASIEQVEADLKRMSTFNTEVRRSLDEADRAKLVKQATSPLFKKE